MSLRRLVRGDEETAQRACRVFGAAGILDARRFLGLHECTLLVFEEDGELLGWAYGHELVHPDGESTMLLYSLDVVPGARGRGIGRSLVSAFVAEARASGCSEVWVLTDEANSAGMATYRSAGGVRDVVPQVMFTWHLTDGRHS